MRLARRRRARDAGLTDSIDVLVVDNDPAVRSSLQAILSVEPGIDRVDTAPTSGIAIKRAIARQPQVCLLDYHLGADAGLLVARHLKRLARAPDVVVYGRSLDNVVAGAARIAGADALIVSPPSARELGQIIRRVADGEKQLPIVTPTAMKELTARLDAEDRPIATMLVRDTPPNEVAAVLGLSRDEMSARRWAILDRLRQPPATLVPGADDTAELALATNGTGPDPAS
jgi:DNA-binding NarL/FixJ family response regulator